jgi:hypothetical protein
MKYYKGKPIGLWILAVWIILSLIYYYTSPVLIWGMEPSSYPIVNFTGWLTIAGWISLILDIFLVYAVTIGFYEAKNWARIYTMIVLSIPAFFSVYFIFIKRVWPYERYAWLVLYVIVLSYLMMSEVREYFGVKKWLI